MYIIPRLAYFKKKIKINFLKYQSSTGKKMVDQEGVLDLYELT